MPCFLISRLELQGHSAARFAWSLADAAGKEGNDPPIGRCLGAEGINVVVARVQKSIIEHGYITTRVLAGPQDLSTGTLILTLVPGRIAAIRPDDESGAATTWFRNAIPSVPGDLLELRDIEQGLENLKRLPTVDADIQIAPTTASDARPGDSDLVVKYRQKFPLRATLSLDDTGTAATGKTQVGATVAWDGPLGLNDLAYLSINHDAFNHDDRGTGGQTVHYAIPFGYTLLALTASRSRYHQTVAGGFGENYVYAGNSSNAEARLSRLVYRDQHRKTTIALRGFRRASTHVIEDMETQHSIVGGWETSLNHREFIGDATLDGTLAYRRGTGAFGAIAASEELFNEGTSRLKLYTADVSLNAPFQLAGQKLRYTALWRAQWNRTPLVPQDRFAIGGRFTVRGFDGETSLLGDRGHLLRSDLGIGLGQSGAELYAGLDHGQVSGESTEKSLGHHLIGGAIGVRGQFMGLNYDLFVGAPIRKPEGFRTARTTGGINFNYSF
jgi:hemolysin activation/secretion protein